MQKSSAGFAFTVPARQAGARLDLFLKQQVKGYSRSALGKLISKGLVLVDGEPRKGGYRVRAGEKVAVSFPDQKNDDFAPEKVAFDILHEDEDILVLVKPPGLVVHPAAGHRSGTLAHGLLYHCRDLPGVEEKRPGIVHRLDKDTSGIMLVAKTRQALQQLTDDFRERKIGKTYHALLLRSPVGDQGRIVAPIGRHPVNRKKMAIRERGGRYAATRFTVQERFANGLCLAELDLETGRTHQIRVHMASIRCPVAGDTLYGGQVPQSFALPVSRQLLHASALVFFHPVRRENMRFFAPLWPDMDAVVKQLQGKSLNVGEQ